MIRPLISCIVPVFNGERYLREALESIFQQTYQPLEVIVVDDGSTDGTASILTSYGERIRPLWQPNAGPAAARNLGLAAAQGEFIAFLDADDLWHPEKLTRQMERFQVLASLDLCATHLKCFWTSESQGKRAQLQGHRLTHILPGYILQTVLVKRALFARIGQFDTTFRLGSDTEWFTRAAEQKAVMELLPDVLMFRRLHDTNITQKDSIEGGMNPDARGALLKIVKASLDRRRLHDPTSPASFAIPASDWRKQSGS